MASTEGQFKIDGVSFYTKTWTPEGPIKAKVIYVHGFSNHINRMNELFERLNRDGIQVLSWDQRGWGRSVSKPAEKGLTGSTARVMADMAAFIEDQLPSDVPIFLFGHSMGGGQVITFAGEERYKSLIAQIWGFILEAPFIGFSEGEQPSSLKVVLGRLAAKLLPNHQLVHEIQPEHLSRDPAVAQSYRDDPLCHNTGTLEGLASLLDRTNALQSGAVKLSKEVRSVLLLHGTRDMICSHDKAMQFLRAQTHVEDKVAKSYDGAYHQLHSDLCKDEFANDVVAWILERCGGDEGQAAKIEAKL